MELEFSFAIVQMKHAARIELFFDGQGFVWTHQSPWPSPPRSHEAMTLGFLCFLSNAVERLLEECPEVRLALLESRVAMLEQKLARE